MNDINIRIENTIGKLYHYLDTYEKICISVSGGRDSDILVHIVSTYMRNFLPKVYFVFCNTGLEYNATKEHIKYLEDKYNITITTVKGMPIPLSVKRYGVPVLSKVFSQVANAYSRNVPYAIERVNYPSDYSGGAHLTDTQVNLCKAIKERGILVSAKCCNESKKKPIIDFNKTNKINLSITGERKFEGGVRSYTPSCFHKGKYNIDNYKPLFYWDNETKQYYNKQENIRNSDCYEIWGFKRTGCVGCPYNSNIAKELLLIKIYEPKLYKAAINTFGVAYKLQDEFCTSRDKIFNEGV